MENPTPKRSKIPYFFFVFFGVVIAVNVAYIYISKKTWRGVVTDEAYQKGINYNDTIEQVKKQNNLGWQVIIKYNRISDTSGLFIISAVDKNVRPITDAEVYINFKRPTQAGFDFVQGALPSGGTYNANVTFPMQGQWDAEVVILRGADTYQEVKRYVIQ